MRGLEPLDAQARRNLLEILENHYGRRSSHRHQSVARRRPAQQVHAADRDGNVVVSKAPARS
jgi:hypothetical protein